MQQNETFELKVLDIDKDGAKSTQIPATHGTSACHANESTSKSVLMNIVLIKRKEMLFIARDFTYATSPLLLTWSKRDVGGESGCRFFIRWKKVGYFKYKELALNRLF